MATAAVSNDPFAAFNNKKATPTKQESAQDMEDRFLKLLVTQMQNQDPLNPLDNAQVTTQMSQISTVSGIEKLNSTVEAMSSNFVQLQALQSASLVGKHVVVPGSKLNVEDGVAKGGYEITAPASNVRIEVLSSSGQVVGTVDQGAQAAGVRSFEWKPPAGMDTSNLSFRVSAANGNVALPANALMRDRVDAVRTTGDTVTLDLRSGGSVPYAGIKAFN
jgi:flagellar basal-body rod modification protein FlgD